MNNSNEDDILNKENITDFRSIQNNLYKINTRKDNHHEVNKNNQMHFLHSSNNEECVNNKDKKNDRDTNILSSNSSHLSNVTSSYHSNIINKFIINERQALDRNEQTYDDTNIYNHDINIDNYINLNSNKLCHNVNLVNNSLDKFNKIAFMKKLKKNNPLYYNQQKKEHHVNFIYKQNYFYKRHENKKTNHNDIISNNNNQQYDLNIKHSNNHDDTKKHNFNFLLFDKSDHYYNESTINMKNTKNIMINPNTNNEYDSNYEEQKYNTNDDNIYSDIYSNKKNQVDIKYQNISKKFTAPYNNVQDNTKCYYKKKKN